MLRFRVLGASCFGLRFRVPRFQNYRLKIGLNWRPPRVAKRHRAVFRLLPTLKTIHSTLRGSQRTADVFPVVASPVAVRYKNNSPIFAKHFITVLSVRLIQTQKYLQIAPDQWQNCTQRMSIKIILRFEHKFHLLISK